MTELSKEQLEAQAKEYGERAERTDLIMSQLREEYPDLPFITTLIMAGDIDGANEAEKLLRAGSITWGEAVSYCGSYSRVEYALKWQEEGFATRDQLLDRWPELWSGSDPDDTDPRFLKVWEEAYDRAGGVVLWSGWDPETDEDAEGKPLPHRNKLKVWRGQNDDQPLGIAWSLSKKVAEKFANGAAVRAPQAGTIFYGFIKKKHVLGYLTGRNEEEIIINPKDLTDA